MGDGAAKLDGSQSHGAALDNVSSGCIGLWCTMHSTCSGWHRLRDYAILEESRNCENNPNISRVNFASCHELSLDLASYKPSETLLLHIIDRYLHTCYSVDASSSSQASEMGIIICTPGVIDSVKGLWALQSLVSGFSFLFCRLPYIIMGISSVRSRPKT